MLTSLVTLLDELAAAGAHHHSGIAIALLPGRATKVKVHGSGISFHSEDY